MTFERPWLLLLTILPFAWCFFEWRKHSRHFGLIVKAVMLLAIALSLAGPVLSWQDRKVALAVVADTSASISAQDLARERKILKQISASKGSNEIEVIPFARAPRDLAPAESDFKLATTAGSAGNGTNLEAPVRQALASLPAGVLHRVLLISDGNENEGALTRAAWQAHELGVAVDTIALGGRERPQILAEAAGLPPVVFTGEQFPVDLTVYTPRATAATVDLAAEGKTIGSHNVTLAAGDNRLRILASLNAAGAIDLSGAVRAEGLGESRFEAAVSVRRPRVVWVTQDAAGSEKHIAALLEANKFDFSLARELPASLDDAQLLVLNNLNFEALSLDEKQRVEKFVQGGGGALWIAGENNMYVDHKGQPEDALARTFPAKLAPPREPEDTVVVLIMDKSASMEGKKIELSRQAATGVIENLRPEDRVGILIFDNSFTWAVPIRKADDKAMLKKLIAGIVPDGGTQIPSALTEAYKKVLPLDATFKHMVLLTDGISEEGDSQKLAKDAGDHKITISTIGLGQDVNKPFLEKIATGAGGKSYFLNDPSGLEQILLHDVKEHTGTVAIEKPISVGVKHPSDLLDKVDMTKAPNLHGYVRFDTRSTADEILQIEGKDPLLVRWQYGLGRATVFASDAKSRWAADWVGWAGFDTLWTNIFRDLLPRGTESEANASFDSAKQELVVDYRLSNRSAASGASSDTVPPEIYAIGPGDFRKPMQLTRVSVLAYQARVRIGNVQGLFRVRPLNDSRTFPEVGLYRPEEELTEYGSNEGLLKSVALSTGGRFNPNPGDAFQTDGQSIESTARLWPILLGAAILLNLVELIARKWRGMLESVRGLRSAHANTI
jgi:Ca-activated chloride channel family protein